MSKVRRRGDVARLPAPGPQYDRAWALGLIRALEQKFALEQQPLISGYAVTNFTETRTLDAATATDTDIANFLCTMVNDLIAAGTIRRSS